jgi:hypothetical protein
MTGTAQSNSGKSGAPRMTTAFAPSAASAVTCFAASQGMQSCQLDLTSGPVYSDESRVVAGYGGKGVYLAVREPVACATQSQLNPGDVFMEQILEVFPGRCTECD